MAGNCSYSSLDHETVEPRVLGIRKLPPQHNKYNE